MLETLELLKISTREQDRVEREFNMGGAQSADKGHGYHVLRVQENSPAHLAGIEPFFDYIVGINGIPLDTPESRVLQDQLLANMDKEVVLAIYSTKEQELREVPMIPNRSWTSNPGDGLIGLSIRFCTYEATNEHVWHILNVAPESPAELAGLIPYTDYIIGTPHVTLHSENDFYEFIEAYTGHPLRLYVYNSDFDACREVVITPNHAWGGEGALGCGVGYGYLHRIPKTNKYHNSQLTYQGDLKQQPQQFNDQSLPVEKSHPSMTNTDVVTVIPTTITTAPLIIETPAEPPETNRPQQSQQYPNYHQTIHFNNDKVPLDP
ncbi:9189_t:CDS:10 [Ambispora leptoticha]|uniref:9189_t:CDS:1 n=1 Tax=Ambispora leptoticha TaxID=144679 RepID=A0A9N8Z094_9GLOM|nr:9189_t:CDS:10 [Ambispora leptoticha]